MHWTGVAMQGGPTFNPLTDLPGTKYVWIAGEDLGADATPITIWNNRANGANSPGQTTAGYKPTVGTFNGRKFSVFDGIDDRMTFGSPLMQNAVSYFAAVRPTTLVGTQALVGNPGSNLYIALSPDWGTYLGGSLTESLLVANTSYLLEMHLVNFNNVDLVRNGISVHRVGTAFSSNIASTLACDPSISQFSNGRLGELFICDALTNPADRLAMRNYLNAKWTIF